MCFKYMQENDPIKGSILRWHYVRRLMCNAVHALQLLYSIF